MLCYGNLCPEVLVHPPACRVVTYLNNWGLLLLVLLPRIRIAFLCTVITVVIDASLRLVAAKYLENNSSNNRNLGISKTPKWVRISQTTAPPSLLRDKLKKTNSKGRGHSYTTPGVGSSSPNKWRPQIGIH